MPTLHRLELWRQGKPFPAEPDDCQNPKCRCPVTGIRGVHNNGTTYRCSQCRKYHYVADKRAY